MVSVDYRLAPEHLFPAGLDDCEKAVAYLMQHAYKMYNVNPRRVVVMGDSAGGGLVASLTQRLRQRHDLPPIKVTFFFCFFCLVLLLMSKFISALWSFENRMRNVMVRCIISSVFDLTFCDIFFRPK